MSKPTQQGITFSKNDVEIIARETLYPVSYTHLTLPTKLEV